MSDKPFRVLMVVNMMPEITNTFVYNQASWLLDKGVDVCFFANMLSDKKEAMHDLVKRYDFLSKTLPSLNKNNLQLFDIVYFQFGFLACDMIEKIRNLGFTGKIFTAFRGRDISMVLPKSKSIRETIVKNGDVFLPVSQDFKQRLISMGFPENRIHVIRSALDLKKFPYRLNFPDPQKPIQILSVGRLIEKKGHDTSIRAIRLVVDRYPNLLFKIIGEGGELEYLKLLITTLHLENNVELLGPQSHNVVINTLADSHIFILPSCRSEYRDEEGIPNSLKEAMATGLPVVSTYHAGIPELIDNGVTGWLVKEKDADALAEKIIYLIEHQNTWKKMCLAARKKIESEYDRNIVNEELYQLFLQNL